MSTNKKELEKIESELKWISVEEMSFPKKVKKKGIFTVLVPLGCLVTTGILFSGIYNMFKRNSRNQQLLMRCRILSQGVTVILAIGGTALQKSSQ